MEDQANILARAASDADDRLLTAEEPLASLQLRCGGELPGTIAPPELRELVRKARRYGFKLARAVCAQDGTDTVTAWVEVEPLSDGQGCELRVLSWHSAPTPVEEPAAAESRRLLTNRHLAELSAQLDAG